jgi:hypothetical protein
MSLLLRFDNTEQVLRSVGDPPNGILGVATPDRTATFVIDSSYQPQPGAQGIQTESNETGIQASASPLDTVDVLDACEGDTELAFVVQAARGTLAACVHYAIIADHWDLDLLQGHIDLLRELERLLPGRLDA